MLNILLGILKVIGILLLTVLSLILFLVLIVLLGPICYRASGEYREEKAFSANISWIFFVFRARVDYAKEKGLLWAVRVFGILIASNDEEFLQKKTEKALIKEKKKRKKEEKHKESVKLPEAEKQEEAVRNPEAEKQEEAVRNPEAEKQEEPAKISEQEEPAELSVDVEPDLKKDRKEQSLPPEKTKKRLSETIKEKFNFIKNKIRNLIQKMKKIPDTIRKRIAGMKAKIENIKAKIQKMMEWKEFFLGERNREGFLHVLNNLKKMIFHILPRKLRGTVEFGVEDPYVMGQILTVLSIFYPVYQEKFTVLPDFENPGFAGEASLKGRIVPGYLVLRLLIALCNREVIRIIKEGRRLIGGNKV